MSVLPAPTAQKSVLDNIGDPRLLEMLAKDPKWASQVNAYIAQQAGSTGGDNYTGATPNWTGLEGYNYTAGGDLSGTPGTVQNYGLFDPTGKQTSSYDYTSEGAGMPAWQGIAGVLGAAFGLPYAFGTMGGAALGGGAAAGAGAGAAEAAASGGLWGAGAKTSAELAALYGAEGYGAGAAAAGAGAAGLMGDPTKAALYGPEAYGPGMTGAETAAYGTGASPIADAWKAIPKPMQNMLVSKGTGLLLGGLLGRATAPGGSSMTPYKGTPMQTPQFTAPTMTPSQGMPGGLGSQSAGLFDQYMRDMLMQQQGGVQGGRATIPRRPEQGTGTY